MKRLLNALDYTNIQKPALEWIIPGVLPKGSMTLLVGPPKAGKSFFALQLALSVSRGDKFLDVQSRPTPVLYLQLDTGEGIWRDRLVDLKNVGVNLDGPCYFVHPDHQMRPVDILNETGRAWMRSLVEESGSQLVVIDVLRELHTADENDSTAMKAVGDALIEILGDRACLMLHHTTKIPPDVFDPDPVVFARGSSYLTGKVDSYWLLYKNRLRVDSRFSERRIYFGEQDKGGLWNFSLFPIKHKVVK